MYPRYSTFICAVMCQILFIDINFSSIVVCVALYTLILCVKYRIKMLHFQILHKMVMPNQHSQKLENNFSVLPRPHQPGSNITCWHISRYVIFVKTTTLENTCVMTNMSNGIELNTAWQVGVLNRLLILDFVTTHFWPWKLVLTYCRRLFFIHISEWQE